MVTLPGSHWSAHRWTLLACVRGRRGEIDYAYLNEDGRFTLLIRRCPSLTERRLMQARAIRLEGDFTWIVLVPKRVRGKVAADDIEILDEASFTRCSPQLARVKH